ncbi:hypothetical protein DY000_02005440 [Brassica cretica]|uniref:Transmembrane protein n=1 Tax=Brassica cretica TaxID=69181 RepID=A0ABQ7BY93_BRACR|nr:hypothetical protein DY000_02005440 [Brassica cretica]
MRDQSHFPSSGCELFTLLFHQARLESGIPTVLLFEVVKRKIEVDVPGEVVGVIPCALSLQSAARSTQEKVCGEAFSVHDLFVPPVDHGDSLAGMLPGGNEALTVGIHSPHSIDEETWIIMLVVLATAKVLILLIIGRCIVYFRGRLKGRQTLLIYGYDNKAESCMRRWLTGAEGRLLQVEGSCAVSVRGVDFSERDLDVVEREDFEDRWDIRLLYNWRRDLHFLCIMRLFWAFVRSWFVGSSMALIPDLIRVSTSASCLALLVLIA